MLDLLVFEAAPAVLAGVAVALLLAGYWLGTLLAGKSHKELHKQLFEQQEALHESDKQLGLAQAAVRTGREKSEDFQQRWHQESERAGQLSVLADRLRERLAQTQARVEVLSATGHELRTQLEAGRDQQAALQAELRQLQEEHVELKTTLERNRERFAVQQSMLEDSRVRLAQEFEQVAGRLFEEKSRTFSQHSQASIDSLLRPFREQIDGFQKRVNEVHDAAQQGNASLNTEIRKLLEAGLKMSEDASNLTSALKGDSQQRGAWGEAQLRRTLEMSGLVEEAHYQVQTSFRDAEGRLKQTDYLIRLPNGKHIIIDSKVTLNAYQRVVEAHTPEQERLALNEHVRAVRRHIDDLAGKDYSSLPGVGSPDFVLMFMPVEPAYIEAMKHDRGLFEYGYGKNIVLVSHTTLIPVLRTVSSLWMLERSQQQAREISERAGDIFSQVCTVAERLGKLGNSLGAVGNHYNSVVTALAGQQGLYGKVERFGQLSARAAKELPQLDTRHPELDTARLQLMAEALPDTGDASGKADG